MNISQLSLNRPVLAVVLNLAILLFGYLGFKNLGVRDFPAIDPPNISVRTSYPGANADIVESQITEPLEKSINGIAGIKNITSVSSQGVSNINVEFELSINLEEAANDVRDKVSQSIRNLPNDLDAPPTVNKADASGEPILSMTIKSDSKNPLELTEFAYDHLIEKLQTIPGVSTINIWGERKYAMRIWLDPVKLSAYKLTPQDVHQALQNESVELPSGKITGNNTELSIRTFGQLKTEDEFNQLIISSSPSGAVVRLRDIGEAVLGPENEETILKESGVPMIALAIVPQPGTSYVSISNEFYKRLESIKQTLPPEYEINVGLDQAKYIKKSISEVKETLIISILLVILIVFFFFRDWVIAFRPLIDIPVSLIGAFFVMYIAGFTINILTLLAIVLATGLVVDDGIVVTENIYKKLESGMSKMMAARLGSQEIYFAVIATSITLAVVFIPVIFLEGFVGSLFREFGVVVAGAVLISAFVSLSLTPVLTVYVSRKSNEPGWFYRVTEPFFERMESGYGYFLNKFLKIRWIAPIALVLCLWGAYSLFNSLPTELAPMEDRSQFRLSLTAPEGTSYDRMDQYVNKLTQLMMDSVPEKEVVLSVTSPGFLGSGAANTGFVRVVLSDPENRKATQDQIVQRISRNLPKYNDGRAFPIQEQTISINRRGGLPVQFVIQNSDMEKLRGIVPKFLEEASKSKVLVNLDSDLKFNKPELSIEIDRARAANLGVSTEEIAQTLQLSYSNLRLGYFNMNGRQYQVIGQMDRKFRDDPQDLRLVYVKSNTGESIPLDQLVQIKEISTTPTIYHFNRYKSATISAGLAPGFTLGDGIDEMKKIAATVLDQNYTTALSGPSRDFAESSGSIGFAFVLALILIYLVLAAQFESFIDPMIIMMTVPLAIFGALAALWMFDHTINIFSQIGMIMLIGLVTKNGILIVDFANQNRKLGIPKIEAALTGAKSRLRPILMTTLAMALGATPIAFSIGASSTSRVPLGVVIIGGLMFSLILTLFVVPAIYTFLSTQKKTKDEQMDH
ncbi:MAG: efflux RND transporter permease subunit [Saprospiraceae bacterium]|nr:efflux RND transporter permease subunit [Saprospiraceae bacterium]MBK9630232.1 efflux RND transporter permease subunit [Saprospiraceae bacterium]